ncbi:MAG TPA: LD-carboxypeptidase [Chitinophagaceae bacterium]|jgi:muramoyltetrapeptide carboxypeptidase|nr:LD-carboxypeptidase [Chitinophagaceae bacterium]
MKRKHFITSAATLLASAALPTLPASANENNPEPAASVIPRYLKKGDTIGITAPAGYISAEEVAPSIQLMESWGYKINVGDTIGKKDFTFAGTDEERLTDFQKMLDDPKVKAIMCARGGYGSIRILDKINWTRFKTRPKWIIGFSDITVLHAHINRNFGIATIHSKMCNSFPDDWSKAEPIQIETIESIHKALSGEKMKYEATPNSNNRLGIAEGNLVGGNLKTLETLAGSASDLYTAGKILFVEDTGEYMYSIDRMFWSLKRTGKLSRLKGLIVGGFKVKTDADTEDFGETLEQIVLEKIQNYKYPVCFDFPVGHQKNNFALKCGIKYRIHISTDSVSLKEI